MVPSDQASTANNSWFVSHWKLEKHDPSHLAYQPSRTPQLELDGVVECERARLESCLDFELETRIYSNPNEVLENDINIDDLATLHALEEEIRHVFMELLSEHEQQVSNILLSSKVLIIITFHDHSIHKSTIVNELNEILFLSNDWLTHLRNFIYFNSFDDYLVVDRHPPRLCC